jgi:hypothetical protein
MRNVVLEEKNGVLGYARKMRGTAFRLVLSQLSVIEISGLFILGTLGHYLSEKSAENMYKLKVV